MKMVIKETFIDEMKWNGCNGVEWNENEMEWNENEVKWNENGKERDFFLENIGCQVFLIFALYFLYKTANQWLVFRLIHFFIFTILLISGFRLVIIKVVLGSYIVHIHYDNLLECNKVYIHVHSKFKCLNFDPPLKSKPGGILKK